MALASSLRDEYSFAHVSDGALLPHGGAGGVAGPQVVLFRAFDEPRLSTTDLDAAALTAWAAANAAPRVAWLDKDPAHRSALKRVFEAKLPKVLAFGDLSGADAPLKAAVDAAALAHPELKFIVGDTADNEGALQFFGLTADDLPAGIVHDTVRPGEKKYVVKNIAPEGIETMIAGFTSGELKATVKSEAPPADNSAPVTILTASNFESIVHAPNASGKTILLEFYAPWCGHCKSLAPIFEKVGAHFAARNDVIIAKMDATANDVPDERFEVKGFPTLYLQTPDNAVLPYQGDRTEAALVAFIEKYAVAGGAAPAAAGKKDPAAELKDEL